MRPLNDYFVGLGDMGSLTTDNNASDWGNIPHSGEVLGFHYNTTAAITGTGATCDVQVAGGSAPGLSVAAGSTWFLPVIADNTGGFAPTIGSRLFVNGNDSLRLLSDGVPATGAVELTMVVRADTHDLNQIHYPLGTFILDSAGTNSKNLCASHTSRLIGFSWTALTAVTHAFTADVFIDTVDQGSDVTFPASAQWTSGFAYCGADIFVEAGSRLKLQSNGEGTSGTVSMSAVLVV